MPTIKGNLLFVSSRAAQVSEVWVRAPRVRTHAEGVVTTGNDRFPVTGGEVSFTAVPGPAVLALISQGRAVDTIPIVVGDAGTQTLRQVVSAAEIADDATKREIEKLAAQAIELVDSSTENARKAQDGATRAETAAGNAEASETNAASSASGAKSSASAASSSASRASSSEQNAAKSASAAADSATQAAGSATSAKQDADRAAQIADSTSWDGDKLTVNGKTSPSLTGPKGDRGDQGQDGKDGASTWSDITGKPSTFPPAGHTHEVGDVTGLLARFGGGNVAPPTAAGDYSVAVGSNASAAGQQSVALGNRATASGGWSVALGDRASATEIYSQALTAFATATKNRHTVIGISATDENIPTDIQGTVVIGKAGVPVYLAGRDILAELETVVREAKAYTDALIVEGDTSATDGKLHIVYE